MIQKKCIDNYSFQTPFFSSLYAHAQTDIGVSIDRCNQRLVHNCMISSYSASTPEAFFSS